MPRALTRGCGTVRGCSQIFGELGLQSWLRQWIHHPLSTFHWLVLSPVNALWKDTAQMFQTLLMREAVFPQTFLRYPSHHQDAWNALYLLALYEWFRFCIIYLICNLCMYQLSRTFPFLVTASAWNDENSFFLKGSTWGRLAKSSGCGWWDGRGQQLIYQTIY